MTSNYRQHITVTCADEDRDGIAQAQTLSLGALANLNGVLSSGGIYTAGDSTYPVGHQVSVYSGADIHTKTFTITGYDPDGVAITDTITNVNASTVESTKYFWKVTSVTADAAVASNFEVGIVDELATKGIPIGVTQPSFSVGIGVVVSGTANVKIQNTYDQLKDVNHATPTITYIDHASLTNKTATFDGTLLQPCTATRLVTNSYSSGAVLTFNVLQNYSMIRST